MPTFEFVASDVTGKPKGKDVSVVRRRCMTGVNKKPNSRRSLREAKRRREEALVKEVLTAVPPPLSSDLNVLVLADKLGPGSRRILYNMMNSDLMAQFMAPIENVIEFPLEKNAGPFDWICHDAPFLYAVLFTGSLMNDYLGLGRQQPGSETYKYLRKSIACLNEKLNDPEAHSQDLTMQTVMNLAMFTAVMGDWDAAWTHGNGLHQIILLKGGAEFLEARPRLHFKIDRVALTLAIGSGKKTLCPREPSSIWKPLYPETDSTSGFSFTLEMIPEIDDKRLILLFRDLQRSTWEMAQEIERGARRPGWDFQRSCNSIQTRLLHLPDRCDDSASELVHLGMFACLTPMFNTPGRQLEYVWLVDRIKRLDRCIQMAFLSEAHADLVIWVLAMTALSVISTQDPWLKEKWALVMGGLGLGLEEIKLRLARVLWFEPFYGKAYQKVHGVLSKEIQCTKLADRSRTS